MGGSARERPSRPQDRNLTEAKNSRWHTGGNVYLDRSRMHLLAPACRSTMRNVIVHTSCPVEERCVEYGPQWMRTNWWRSGLKRGCPAACVRPSGSWRGRAALGQAGGGQGLYLCTGSAKDASSSCNCTMVSVHAQVSIGRTMSVPIWVRRPRCYSGVNGSRSQIPRGA